MMLKKAALLFTGLLSLTMSNVRAGSAVVASTNGVYAAAWGPFLSADSAVTKATELCQQKGGINIKVIASRGADPSAGMMFCSIAASGHGPGAIVGSGYGTIPPAADGAAFVDCRQRGGTSPHIVVGWKERGYDGPIPGTRVGRL